MDMLGSTLHKSFAQNTRLVGFEKVPLLSLMISFLLQIRLSVQFLIKQTDKFCGVLKNNISIWAEYSPVLDLAPPP